MEREEPLITVDELAETFRVYRSWVYSRTREKGPDAIPRIKVGKYYRFKKSEVMDWLRKRSASDE